MAKSRKTTRPSKPLSQGTDTRAGVPKNSAKVNGQTIMKDSIEFTSQRPANDAATGATSQFAAVYALDPIAPSTTTISVQYNEYKTRRFVWRYRPSVGVNTSGRIWIGYFQSPEIGYKMYTGAITTADAIIATKFCANVRTFPVHQPFDFNVDPSMRTKLYDINQAVSGQIDWTRSIHGTLFCFSEGAPANTTLGTCFLEGSFMLKGLSNSTYAPTLRSGMGAEDPRVILRPYKPFPPPYPSLPTPDPDPQPEPKPEASE